MDCVFCKIVRKEIPTQIFYEDNEVMVMLDINPAAPFHYLIIPKEHIPSIIDLKDCHKDLISKIIYKAKETALRLNLSGYKLVFNVGKDGGQVVGHLHLHLLGGWNKNSENNVLPE